MLKKYFSTLYLIITIFLTSCISMNSPKNSEYFMRNGIYFFVTAHDDDYIRVKAVTSKYEDHASDFKLEIPFSDQKITKDSSGNFNYKNYSIKPTSNGYTLYVNDQEKYTSSFEKFSSTDIDELRVYKNNDAYYGLGQVSKHINLKGKNFLISHNPAYGDQTYLYIPFYITENSDSVYYNAQGYDKISFPISEDEASIYATSTGKIDSYFRASDDYKDSVSSFYNVSKSKSLIPEWAFGFIQSKYGYKNDAEVREIMERFKKEDIPLSAIVLDLYWFNKMGDLDWNKEKFPDPEGLSLYLNDNGVKLITITEPFFTSDCLNYENFDEKGYFAIDEKGRTVKWSEWWCFGAPYGSVINPIADGLQGEMGKIYSKMIDTGIDGFWTDLGEPERVPHKAEFNGITERYFHNYFNREWSRIIHDGVKEHYPDKRLFILSRSGYTGSGQYNVSIWTGDVTASFDALKQQIPLGLSAGLSGFSYWGTDVGGFVPEYSSPELMVRWYQFGAFTPVFRAHGTGNREPWAAGGENTTIIKKYINYRYQFLPYTYSLAAYTYRDGLPIMRPMFMEFENTDYRFFNKQYMYGDYMLISPVTNAMTFNKESETFLPEGKWYDLETFKTFEGGKVVNNYVKLDTMPVFIRDGAIIPMQYKNYENAVLIIPGNDKKTEFIYYKDDGITEKYKDGNFTEIKITLQNNTVTLNSNEKISNITLIVPSNFEGYSSWQEDGKYRIKKIDINEIEKTIELR